MPTKSSRHPSKLSIVGAGAVGTSLAYAALIRGSASIVSLYDIATKKVDAEVKDLAHGTQFTNSIVMGGDDISVVKDSSVVIITAGAKQKPGQTRLDLAATNAKILEQMMPQLVEQAPNALFVLVTNPCDVLTVVAQKVSGLPSAQVFSTGTMLDTSRLRYLVAQKGNVAQRNVHAMIVGEHGDSEFPVWSSANISSVPIMEWTNAGRKVFSQHVLDDLAHEAAFAAYEVIEGKGATNYAIGLAGARLVEALLSPTRTVLPLSTVLDGQYGIHDVALSLPTLVSNRGVYRVLDVPMDPTEVTRLHESAEQLRASLDTLGY